MFYQNVFLLSRWIFDGQEIAKSGTKRRRRTANHKKHRDISAPVPRSNLYSFHHFSSIRQKTSRFSR
jgi:hypothetical protein